MTGERQQVAQHRRTRLLGLLSVVVGVLVGFLLIEGGLRAYERFVLHVPPVPSAKGAIHVGSAHRGRIYELAPNAHMEREGVVIRTNSLGMRDDEPDLDGAKDLHRVLMLGDSVAWGFGVPTAEAFPQLLERRLNERASREGRPGTVVFNAAVDGYTLRQQVATFEALSPSLQPELTVVAYVLNDPATEQDGGLARYFRNEFLVSRYFRIARERMHELSLGEGLPTDFYQRIHRVHREDVRTDLARLRELAKAEGSAVVLLVCPLFDFKPGSPYGWQNIHDDIRRYAEELELVYVDVWPQFEQVDASTVRIDTLHPNSRGHELIVQPLEGVVHDLLYPEAAAPVTAEPASD